MTTMREELNESRLVHQVWEELQEAETPVTKESIELVLRAIKKAIPKAIAQGYSVRLKGFALFTYRKEGARTRRTPSGAMVQTPERLVPKVNPGIKLKEACKAS